MTGSAGVFPALGYLCPSLTQSSLIISLKLISGVKDWKRGQNEILSPLVDILLVYGGSWTPACVRCTHTGFSSGFLPSPLCSYLGLKPCLECQTTCLLPAPCPSYSHLPPGVCSEQGNHPPSGLHQLSECCIAGSRPPDWNFLEVNRSTNQARDQIFLDISCQPPPASPPF